MDELATNQLTRIVQKPFEGALACQPNDERSFCKLNVVGYVMQQEIQVTTLHSENLSSYNRFC